MAARRGGRREKEAVDVEYKTNRISMQRGEKGEENGLQDTL
jgi:hypothetical protein